MIYQCQSYKDIHVNDRNVCIECVERSYKLKLKYETAQMTKQKPTKQLTNMNIHGQDGE